MSNDSKKYTAAMEIVADLYDLDIDKLRERPMEERSVFRALERIGFRWVDSSGAWSLWRRPWMEQYRKTPPEPVDALEEPVSEDDTLL